jgi:hypothetical protein
MQLYILYTNMIVNLKTMADTRAFSSVHLYVRLEAQFEAYRCAVHQACSAPLPQVTQWCGLVVRAPRRHSGGLGFDSQKGSLSTHYVHIVACIPISITARVFFPIPDIVPLLCVCTRAEGAGDTI